MSITRDEFKAGMRRLAASVCVITVANADGTRGGLTATAVCSMSADPPTLLCALNKSSNSYPAIERAGAFGVNVLGPDHHGVAQRFSSSLPGEEKFQLGDWTQAAGGSPLLTSAVVAFDCRLTATFEVATHVVMIGEIDGIILGEGGSPLLYADGSYGAFTVQEALAAAGVG